MTFSFLRRRERSSWGVLVPSPGQKGAPACLLGLLTAWGRLLLMLEGQVILPSFFVYQVLELFNLSVFNFIKPRLTYLVNEAPGIL